MVNDYFAFCRLHFQLHTTEKQTRKSKYKVMKSLDVAFWDVNTDCVLLIWFCSYSRCKNRPIHYEALHFIVVPDPLIFFPSGTFWAAQTLDYLSVGKVQRVQNCFCSRWLPLSCYLLPVCSSGLNVMCCVSISGSTSAVSWVNTGPALPCQCSFIPTLSLAVWQPLSLGQTRNRDRCSWRARQKVAERLSPLCAPEECKEID